VNYYERHLGDYARDTMLLSQAQHGAYTLLIDSYYATEQGIDDGDKYAVTRAFSKLEREATDYVLRKYFKLVDGVWVKNKIQEELAKSQARIDAARKNGGKGGRPKLNPTETQQKPSGLYPGSENETHLKAHQTPYTSNQLNIVAKDKNSRSVDAPPSGFLPTKRPTRKLPDDFVVTDSLREWAIDNKITIDIDAQTKEMRDYTYKTTQVDWQGAWRNWMRKAQTYANERARFGQSKHTMVSKHAGAGAAIFEDANHV
jgi:uncharacterized protein YdaU (DUF1376 family)